MKPTPHIAVIIPALDEADSRCIITSVQYVLSHEASIYMRKGDKLWDIYGESRDHLMCNIYEVSIF